MDRLIGLTLWLLLAVSAFLVYALLMQPATDYGKCLRVEPTTMIIMQTIGTVMFPMPIPTTVCTQWELPNGRPVSGQ